MSNYQIAFWLITVVFGIILTIAGWLASNWARRIDENFRDLFAKLDYMAEQKDMDSLGKEVRDLHDRVVTLESKIKACKSCNG